MVCTIVLSGAWIFLALQYMWCYKVATGFFAILKGGLKKDR